MVIFMIFTIVGTKKEVLSIHKKFIKLLNFIKSSQIQKLLTYLFVVISIFNYYYYWCVEGFNINKYLY